VQVLSVVKIAPVSGGAARSALGARNNPATIIAINDDSTFEVVFILFAYFLIAWGEGVGCCGPRKYPVSPY